MSNSSQSSNQPASPVQNEQTKDHQFNITESSYKTTHTAVRKARRFAMQGLYEWLMTDRRFEQSGKSDWQENAPHDIAARTRANNAMHTVHLGYYHDMMRDIPAQIDELQALITQHLDRDINLLDPIEHAILLIGTYELKNRLEVPYKVVLDEAMKLNTHFGATDAHKLINAVLDKLAPVLRQLEVAADSRSEKPQQHTNKDADNTTNTNSVNTNGDTVAVDETRNQSVDTNAHQAVSNNTKTVSNTKPRIGRNASKKGAPVKRSAKLGTQANPKSNPTND